MHPEQPRSNRPDDERGPLEAPGHSLDRRKTYDENGCADLSPEWETRAAISAILDITMREGNFKALLAEILEVIVSVSWLGAAKQGAIFVANRRGELVLTVHHSMAPQLLTACAKVPYGRCLCGKAAAKKQIVFKDCVDADHETRFEGMKPHGHYNLPLLNQGEVIGVMVLYLEHGHVAHPEERLFMEMLGRTVSGFILSRSLKLRAEISSIRFQRAQQEMVRKLVAASEYRDNETGAHIQRMSQYACIVGRAVGLDKDELTLLELAAPMHDIGKVGIADSILLKPGRLSPEEFSIMKEHTRIGAKLLTGDHPLLQASREIALTHHERWDGKGYPEGLAGADIPLFGRICALVDVFDALTSERPYKEAWPIEEAVQFMSDNSGTHFDPVLVEAFLASMPEILEMQALYNSADTEDLALGTLLRQRSVRHEVQSWSEDLSVGVAFVDNQHQFLVNLINRIHSAQEDSDAAELTEALLDMQSYAEIHFREEEELMCRVGYPGLEQHKQQHARFSSQTVLFIDELAASPLAVCTEISSFLRDWLIDHIQVADKAYAAFMQTKAA